MNEFTYPKGPDVYWEKWVDPYQLTPDELQWNEFDEESDQQSKELKFTETTEYEKEFEGDYEKPTFIQVPGIKHLFTPFGIIPLTEHSHPAKVFKFWTGHTNFNITKDLAFIVSQVPGVETLNIWTRYRFRIGIGKMFDDKNVMYSVKEAMIGYHKERINASTEKQEQLSLG